MGRLSMIKMRRLRSATATIRSRSSRKLRASVGNTAALTADGRNPMVAISCVAAPYWPTSAEVAIIESKMPSIQTYRERVAAPTA